MNMWSKPTIFILPNRIATDADAGEFGDEAGLLEDGEYEGVAT